MPRKRRKFLNVSAIQVKTIHGWRDIFCNENESIALGSGMAIAKRDYPGLERRLIHRRIPTNRLK